jgi:hypothetical protein
VTPDERPPESPIDWPVATLDPIGRAKILASAIPSAAWAEGVIEAPFAETWGWITDFERSVPRFDTDIESIAVHARSREGNVEHVRLTARSHGVPVPFDVRLEEGFCLMRGRARVYLVVMAAQPAGDHTRFLHLEAIPLPGTRFLHSRLQRMVNADLRRLSNVARHGF